MLPFNSIQNRFLAGTWKQIYGSPIEIVDALGALELQELAFHGITYVFPRGADSLSGGAFPQIVHVWGPGGITSTPLGSKVPEALGYGQEHETLIHIDTQVYLGAPLDPIEVIYAAAWELWPLLMGLYTDNQTLGGRCSQLVTTSQQEVVGVLRGGLHATEAWPALVFHHEATAYYAWEVG